MEPTNKEIAYITPPPPTRTKRTTRYKPRLTPVAQLEDHVVRPAEGRSARAKRFRCDQRAARGSGVTAQAASGGGEGARNEAPAAQRLQARGFARRGGVVDEAGVVPDTGQGLWVVRALWSLLPQWHCGAEAEKDGWMDGWIEN